MIRDHGTSSGVANIIVRHGFDERVAALSGLYGAGVYFANQSCKAGQYTAASYSGEKILLIARVTLGDPYYATSNRSQERRPPDRNSFAWSKGLTYDSVVANSGGSQAHRELIIYDHRQAYPSYIVRYRDG